MDLIKDLKALDLVKEIPTGIQKSHKKLCRSLAVLGFLG